MFFSLILIWFSTVPLADGVHLLMAFGQASSVKAFQLVCLVNLRGKAAFGCRSLAVSGDGLAPSARHRVESKGLEHITGCCRDAGRSMQGAERGACGAGSSLRPGGCPR